MNVQYVNFAHCPLPQRYDASSCRKLLTQSDWICPFYPLKAPLCPQVGHLLLGLEQQQPCNCQHQWVVTAENFWQTSGANLFWWSNLCVTKSGEKKNSKATTMQQMCPTLSISDARVNARVTGIDLWDSQLDISQLQVVQFLFIPAEAADLVLTLHFVSSSTKCSCTDHQVN